MTNRYALALISGAVMVTAPLMSSSLTARQAPAVAPARAAVATATVPRTPWGDPDLQGTWTSEAELSVPFERGREFGERQLLTDQEFAARRRADRIDSCRATTPTSISRRRIDPTPVRSVRRRRLRLTGWSEARPRAARRL